MSFTYVDPSESDNDACRFTLGDTIDKDHIFEDEEIAWALDEEGNDIRLAAALCADSAVAKYARQPTSSTLGETSITFGNLTAKFKDLADHLRMQGRRDTNPIPWTPGATTATPYTPIAVPLSNVPEV